MRKAHARVAAVLLLCCCCALAAGARQGKPQGKQHLRAIEILPFDAQDEKAKESVSPKRFIELTGQRAAVDLELGEWIEERDVVLHRRPGAAAAEFKVEQRSETSLTIQNEGPHLDLREWKHHYSEWIALDELGENRFRIRELSEADLAGFPDVSPEEIREAVWSAGGDEWAALVKDVKGPRDYPAAVSLSKLTLRVSVKEGDGWKVIHLIDFLVPMGC